MKYVGLTLAVTLVLVGVGIGADCMDKTPRKHSTDLEVSGKTGCTNGLEPPNERTWECANSNFSNSFVYSCDATKEDACCGVGPVVSAQIVTYICGALESNPCTENIQNIMGVDFIEKGCDAEGNCTQAAGS